jgi:DNA-directed RNA polymerase specialized sigma subunit
MSKFQDARYVAICELRYLEHKTTKEIADIYNITKQRVGGILRQLHELPPHIQEAKEQFLKEERVTMSKFITTDDRTQMKMLRSYGLTLAAIGERYGISRQRVYQILGKKQNIK